MTKFVLSIVLLVAAFASAAGAASPNRLERQLRELDPSTRLEQVCDIEAMRQINRDPNAFHPDRAVLAATAEPKTTGNIIRGTGGAFRNKGKWYRFSFVCEASDDHMQVLRFEYKLGDAIPEEQWAKDGLWE